MHELSLASAIVATVEDHADGCPVRVISLRVGALRQVVPESLAFYLEVVGRDTVCEGARVDLDLVAARVACCDADWEPPPFRCPSCAGAGVVVAGDEFLVESIEIEEEACIAST